jgi:hypothetical protein
MSDAGLPELIDALEGWGRDTGGDYGLTLEVAKECWWSLEVRLTPSPNRRGGPDVSTVFFTGGHGDSDESARAILSSKRFRAAVRLKPPGGPGR